MERLYLVQHGKAKSKDEDSERPLHEEGIEETASIASRLTYEMDPDIIIHSPKTRSKQTAEIFQRICNPKAELMESEDVTPMSDPKGIILKVEEMNGEVMIVGHLPHLSKLISLLTTGDEENQPLKVTNSGVTCIAKSDDSYQICWSITSDLNDTLA